MFIIFLRFAENRDAAGEFMPGHNAWLKQGFDDGIFLLAGSLQNKQGGCILAANSDLSELESRIEDDPFVAENVVSPEVIEFVPGKADERLQFLLD